ncbi:MAG: hypothetical protein ACKO23_01575 [Gemmataceae bacterium]
MRKWYVVGLLLLAGCAGTVGPLQRRHRTDRIDDPRLTPDQQKERERDRLPLPDASWGVGPRTYSDNPALKGP